MLSTTLTSPFILACHSRLDHTPTTNAHQSLIPGKIKARTLKDQTAPPTYLLSRLESSANKDYDRFPTNT